jgi:transcriptional regulator with XRE-family HTH domain
MSTWASRIRELQTAGMTLAEIGEQTGLATSTVGDLASGRSSSPRGDAALRLHSLHEQRVKHGQQPTAPSAARRAAP